MSYHGWFNKSTWNAALWLFNYEHLWDGALNIVRRNNYEIAPFLLWDYTHDMFGSETPDGDKLNDVHWGEIDAALREHLYS